MARKRYRIRTVWDNMRQRCSDKNNRHYGGKGISVCKEWTDSFKVFEKWPLEHGYDDSLTIDRVDSKRGYSPENCRWVPVKVQNNNTSRNRLILIGDEVKTLAQWCELFGIPPYIADNRINKYGWSEEEALRIPINATNHKGNIVEYKGMCKNLMDWSRTTGISYRVLYNRIVEKKWDVERAFSTPIRTPCHHN